MGLTQSTMMALGSAAPNFSLPATDGAEVSLNDFNQYDALVVLFICNHCPYVVHIAKTLTEMAADYQQKGIGFVAISSNDIEQFPADDLAHMQKEKQKWGYSFPYLLDETQRVAQAYNAACTPDIYVFNKDRALVYRGQFDDTRPNRISSGNYDSTPNPATGESLAAALDQLVRGEPVTVEQIPSMGCNIKWKEGLEPNY